jgi:Tfp pilus assembly protein PilN
MYNLNEKIAYKATKIFGSMGAFWIFTAWAFLPLLPILKDYKETILYISSGFIQLVALPLIMVGQEILGRSAERRSQIDHVTLQAQFSKIQILMEEIKDMHKDTHKLLEKAENSNFEK